MTKERPVKTFLQPRKTFRGIYFEDIIKHAGLFELVCFIVTAYWAVILALPLNTFRSSTSYEYLLRWFHGQEQFMAMGISLSVLAYVIAYVYDRRVLRTLNAGAQAAIWTPVGISIYLSNHASTGTGVYLTLGLINLVLFIYLIRKLYDKIYAV